MSIVDALKKLVVAFGGASEPEEVPGANVADVIEELAKNPPSGGGAAAPLVVHSIYEEISDPDDPESSMPIFRLDKTYREIEDAVLSGRSVLVYGSEEETNTYAYVSLFSIGSETGEADDILYCVRFGEAAYFAETKDNYPSIGGSK